MFEPEVVLGAIEKALKNNRVFGDLLTTEDISFLVHNSLISRIETGQVLCQQNQVDQTLYLIICGEMDVTTLANGREVFLAKLGAGEIVGELSALFSIPRIAKVKASRPSIVLQIPANVFSDILRENDQLKNAVVKRCKDRIVETSLRSVPVFSKLNNESLRELGQLSSLVKASKGMIVAHEGKTERRMYVICSGTARVYITTKAKEVTVALLNPGDYFGEYSLFTGEPRSASVSALTDLQLVVLEGEAFQSFMDYNEDTEQQINIDAYERLDELDALRGNRVDRRTAEQRLTEVQALLESLY